MNHPSIVRALRASTVPRGSLAALLLAGVAVALPWCPAVAGEAPVVRQVEAAPTPAPAAQTSAARTSEPAPIAVGDITRALLAAQADGRRAGSELGIPGPVASASWKRYVESFTYPQPELFEARLEKSSSN